ncbi:RNase Sy [Hesseltinella vesiculosa]|uniref:ribonuclease T2 n=1 Tax=Hesseltinella vesiculosa TaxID=101127 RepID=A0A1X2GW25_9FUNG|nr:RNase Sy [Hesseltinella vesiculosa]
MKFSLLLASLAPLAMALPAGSLVARSCPANALSCSSNAGDSCCSPTNGILILVQQWVPGYGPSDAFTMHGLWPDTCNGGQTGSTGCDSTRSYSNVGSIIQSYNSTLYDNMNTYWPSDAGANTNFWTHEWDKHGTCVSTLAPKCYANYQQYEDVNDYFSTALGLRAQYDLYNALSTAGITPGSSTDIGTFSQALQTAFGVVPKVDCSSGTLSEVWLYFNVQNTNTFVPIDAIGSNTCTGSVNYPTK